MQKKDTMPASIIRFFSLSKNFLSVYKRYFSYRYYLIFERRLEKRNKLPLTLKVPNANLFIIDAPTEVDKLISSGYDLSPCHHFSRLKDKLNKGAVLFVVFIGKEFAHSCWVAMNNNPAICDHLFQRIFYRGVYIGPAQTIEPYRGKGIFPYVLSKICEFIFKKGETRVLINTRVTNLASKRSIAKAGFDVVSVVRYLRLLSWESYKILEVENLQRYIN